MPIQLSGSLVITGSITTTGVITMSGSIASASYSSTSDLLQGTGSVGFSTTASLFEVSSSQQQISASLLNVIANYATTGSNSFRANQSITGSLVVSSTITAQTLVVQTVTSSIVFSSGSNSFGNQLANNQTFTGSVNITGSLALAGNITGNAITLTGALSGTSATFSLGVTIANNNWLNFTDSTATSRNILLLAGDDNLYLQYKAGSNFYLRNTDGDLRLTIASTGAATFSSSVTAGSMFVNTTDNSSGAKLQVFGSINFKGNSGYNGWIISQTGGSASAAFNLSYGAGGAQNVITAQYDTGNVGIGTSSPNIGGYGANGRILTIQGVSGSYGILELTSNSANADGNAIGRLDFGSDGQAANYKAISSIASFLSGSTSTKFGADLRFYTRADNAGTGDPVERMRITSTGNVGIGTATPLSTFHANCCVAGGATTTVARFGVQDSTGYGTTSPAIELTGTNIGLCFTIGKIAGINDVSSGGSLAFSTGLCAGTVVERMRITNCGNVGIGTNNPSYSLSVNTGWIYNYGAQNASGFRYENNASGHVLNLNANNSYAQLYTGTTTALYFGSNNILSLGINTSGHVIAISDNAYTMGASGQRWSAIWSANGTIQTSDEREKKDITNTDLGLDFISNLRPVCYKWKVGQNIVTREPDGLDENGNEQFKIVITPREGTRVHYGLIAQEVKQVLGDKDFGGYIHDEDTDIKGLRYDQFIAPLIKAIQELSAKVTALETK